MVIHRPCPLPLVKSSPCSAAYVRQWTGSAFGAKPSSNPMLDYCHWALRDKLQWNFNQNTKLFIHENTSVQEKMSQDPITTTLFYDNKITINGMTALCNYAYAMTGNGAHVLYWFHPLLIDVALLGQTLCYAIRRSGLRCFHSMGHQCIIWCNPFYPRPVLAFGYCHRLCVCVCQLFLSGR